MVLDKSAVGPSLVAHLSLREAPWPLSSWPLPHPEPVAALSTVTGHSLSGGHHAGCVCVCVCVCARSHFFTRASHGPFTPPSLSPLLLSLSPYETRACLHANPQGITDSPNPHHLLDLNPWLGPRSDPIPNPQPRSSDLLCPRGLLGKVALPSHSSEGPHSLPHRHPGQADSPLQSGGGGVPPWSRGAAGRVSWRESRWRRAPNGWC